MFIEKTLRSEQDEYAREGIQWQPIPFFDNKVVCELIEAKPRGVFAYLDEECLLGQGTDDTLVDKLERNLSQHPHFERPKPAVGVRAAQVPTNVFTIKHYAGPVTYSSPSFLEKNKDLAWRDFVVLGESSKLLPMNHPAMFPKGTSAALSRQRPPTASTTFKSQIGELMNDLNACAPSVLINFTLSLCQLTPPPFFLGITVITSAPSSQTVRRRRIALIQT